MSSQGRSDGVPATPVTSGPQAGQMSQQNLNQIVSDSTVPAEVCPRLYVVLFWPTLSYYVIDVLLSVVSVYFMEECCRPSVGG